MPGFTLATAEDVRKLREVVRKVLREQFTAESPTPAGRKLQHHTKEGIVIQEIAPSAPGKLQVYTKPQGNWTVSTDEILDVSWPDDTIGTVIPVDAYLRVVWINGEWRPVDATGGSQLPFPAALIERSGDTYSWVEMQTSASGWHIKPCGRCGDLNAAQFNHQSHNCQGGNWPEIVLMYPVHDWEEDVCGGATDQRQLNDAGQLCSVDASQHAWGGGGVRYYFEYSVGPNEDDSERYGYQLGDNWDRNAAPSETKGVLFHTIGVQS